MPSCDINVILDARETIILFGEKYCARVVLVIDVVGLYLLAQVKDSFPILTAGLYRDDALFSVRGLSRAFPNRLKKYLVRYI